MADNRRGTLIVCDDLLLSLNGKWNLLGHYPADIVIQIDGTPINQLIFVFYLETDIDDPFRSLTLEVTLPGAAPHQVKIPQVNLVPSSPVAPGRTKIFFRSPVLMQQIVLRPGQIKGRAIHESGEIALNGPWITLAAPQASS